MFQDDDDDGLIPCEINLASSYYRQQSVSLNSGPEERD